MTCGQEPTIDELPLWHLEPIAALLPQVGTPTVALIKQRSPCVTNRPGLVWDEPNAAPVIFSHHFLSNLLTFSGFYHHHTSQFYGHILCMTKSGEITDRFFLANFGLFHRELFIISKCRLEWTKSRAAAAASRKRSSFFSSIFSTSVHYPGAAK